MGVVADRMDAMTVRVYSPDKRITAVLAERNKISLAFAPGSYQNYTEDVLGSQLSRLAVSLWVGLQRGTDQVNKEAGLTAVRTSGDAWDGDSRRFLEQRREIVGRGRSPHDCVKVEAIGLRDWQVRIRPGTLAWASEPELISEVLAATWAARADYAEQVEALLEQLHL